MDTPEQQDRDNIYPWGYDPEEVREYYETTKREREHEATISSPTSIVARLRCSCVTLIKTIFD